MSEYNGKIDRGNSDHGWNIGVGIEDTDTNSYYKSY